ncbi:MAG: thiamine phosphate synthase [Planctomycetales bacterium]
METTFTPGAQRVTELAAQIAGRRAALAVEPEHLLWALVLDESRAAEILAGFALSAERLEQCLFPIRHSREDQSPPEPLPPHSEILEAVYLEARRQVVQDGRNREVGTEHLLGGLATIDSSVRQLLEVHGVAPADVLEQVEAHSGDSSTPLPAEEPLALAPPPVGEQTDLYRILDAAANRLNEGLRVIEDYVRFAIDDRHLTERLKGWRHRFAGAVQSLDSRALLAARDTLRDVGTTVQTPRERSRESLADVVRASCKRVQEASRTLEEYGKIVSPQFGQTLQELRYEAYTIEKGILTRFESQGRLGDCRLYLLATQSLCPGGAGPVIRAALAEGVDVVQVREKRLPDRELLTWARYVRDWTAAAGALFIMNDRPDLAVLADADGVHVGQDELTVRDARRIVGPDKLVGVSTHNLDQARQAVLDGADYIGVGPVFPSGTKSFPDFPGLDFVRQIAWEITLPAFAIGGIDAGNVTQVVAAFNQGGGPTIPRIAVSGAICGAEDPAQVTRELRAALCRTESPRQT